MTTAKRPAFTAGMSPSALADELDAERNTVCKVIFDARRKIRRALVAKGYLEEQGLERRWAT